MLYVIILAVIAALMGFGVVYHRPNTMSFKASIELTELPIITLFQGEEKFNFLIDTGSTYSYINPKCLTRCNANKTNWVAGFVDCNGNAGEADVYDCIFNLENQVFEFQFNSTDLPGVYEGLKEQFGVNVHGVIGSDFLKNYNYILDFEKYIAYSKK